MVINIIYIKRIIWDFGSPSIIFCMFLRSDSDKKIVSTDAIIGNDAHYVSEGTINNIDG